MWTCDAFVLQSFAQCDMVTPRLTQSLLSLLLHVIAAVLLAMHDTERCAWDLGRPGQARCSCMLSQL